MKLYAISDLHLGYKANRQALEQLPAHPEDWLILGGDVGETTEHLAFAFRVLTPRFRQLVWVPGNHELWTVPTDGCPVRGQEKYQQLVSVCHSHEVLTPEDPYPVWTGEGGAVCPGPTVFAVRLQFSSGPYSGSSSGGLGAGIGRAVRR